MTRQTDQLTDTFSAHEHLAPDAAEVLAKAHGIARSYQRRRWAVRATGGAVLGAAVVAGGVAIPGEIHGNSAKGSTATTFLSGGDSSPTPAPTTASYTEQQELDAYFQGGYDYTNAQALASLWNSTGDIASVKAAAGLKLLEGATLPVKPNGTPATPAEKAEDAFFEANYDYTDASALAVLWHETDITKVKIKAGELIEAGSPLPIAPGAGATMPGLPGAQSDTETPAEVQADNARAEFFAKGYTYNDAVKLATLWKESDPFQTKAVAGQKLLDGDPLPIAP